MTLSEAGLDLISGFEGFSAVAYRDQGSVLTIGYGHTQGVKEGDTCTREQALQWLQEDLHTASEAVTRLASVPLTQNQFDALTSFCYNVGQGNLSKSTLLKLLNGGDNLAAAAQFLEWDKINGVISKGLLNRRTAERDLFMKPEEPA